MAREALDLLDAEMTDYNLMLGDCIEQMASIPAGSVDLVLTDPPYGTTACAWDAVIPFEPMWREVRRVLKPRGAAVFTASQPFTSALVMSNPREFRYPWVWNKVLPRGHLNAKKQPMRLHEDVLVFSREPHAYNPQKTSGHKRKVARTKYQKGGDGGQVYGREVRDTVYDSEERFPTSIYTLSTAERGKVHPTQKPVALMEYLIRTYTNEGEIVLDFTMGSGTTGVACVNTGRKFIGIEKDPAFFETAKARILAAKAGPVQKVLL